MGTSYGERLSPLDPTPGGYALVIVVPPFELSTPAVYSAGTSSTVPKVRDSWQATATVAAHPRPVAE